MHTTQPKQNLSSNYLYDIMIMQPCHCLLSLLHALALHISLDPTHALLMCLLSVNQTGVYCEPDWCVQWTRLVCTRGFALLKICTYIWIICECAVGHIFCPHIGVGMYIMWCIIVCFVILNLMCKCDDKCAKCYICLM